jgi:hypothetical protein
MQRAAAASTTARMSTPESPRSRSGFSSAFLMSAGEAATLRANSPMAACSGSVDSSTRGFGSSAGLRHYFGWPRVRSGGGLLALGYRISRDAIHKHIKRAGVPFHERGLANEQKTEAERLYLFGWSLQRLANRDGKDDETIRRISRSGVHMRDPWEPG